MLELNVYIPKVSIRYKNVNIRRVLLVTVELIVMFVLKKYIYVV